MVAEAQAYREAFHTHWEQVRATIQNLPAAALNWRPLEQDTSSAVVIVTHMCGLASLVVYQVLTGMDVHRERAAEFQATATTTEELLSLVDRTEAHDRSALDNATASSLNDTVTLPGREPMSRRVYVIQAIRHLGEHLGHLQLTMQLWSAQK